MINAENKQVAIDDFNYGPSTNPEEACGSCTAYNITPEMLDVSEMIAEWLGTVRCTNPCAPPIMSDSYASGGPIEDLVA